MSFGEARCGLVVLGPAGLGPVRSGLVGSGLVRRAMAGQGKESRQLRRRRLAKVFKGGIPQQPDIVKLLAAFEDVQVGTVIEHSRIESVLGYTRASSRYRSVVSKWIKVMRRERQVVISGRHGAGLGYAVLDHPARVDAVRRDHRHVARTAVTAREKLETVQPGGLAKGERAAFDAQVAYNALLLQIGTPKRIAAPKEKAALT